MTIQGDGESRPLARLHQLTDAQLVSRADAVARREHDEGLQLLEVLNELDERSVCLSLGYSSLFDFCTRRWLFSRAKAGRYIAVARALRAHPALRGLLEQRRLTIGNAALLVGVLTETNRQDLLRRAAGRTYREIEVLTASLRPARPVPESIRPVGVVCTRRGIEAATTDTKRADGLGTGASVAIAPGAAAGPGGSSTSLASSRESPDPVRPRGGGSSSHEKAALTGELGPSAVTATAPEASRLETASRGLAPTPAYQAAAEAVQPRPADQAAVEAVQPRPADQAAVEAVQPRPADQAAALDLGGGPESHAETRYEIRFAVSGTVARKLERVRAIRSGQPSLEGLFETLLDVFLERHDPELREKRRVERRARAKEGHRRAACATEGVKAPPTRSASEAASDGRKAPRDRRADQEAETRRSGDSETGPAGESQGSRRVGASAGDRDPQRLQEPRRERDLVRALELPEKRGSRRDRGDHGSRRVARRTRDAVFVRDGGRCTFVGSDGVRCGSKRHLQIDHIRPLARGGRDEITNLRLLCGQHNRFEARRILGPWGAAPRPTPS